MRTLFGIVVGTILPLGAVCASAQRPDFSGTWVLDPSGSVVSEDPGGLKLTIQQKPSSIHYTEQETGGSEVVADFTCNTNGKDCKMRDRDHDATVAVYYNGDALVVLKTNGRRGDVVTKQRLTLAKTGDSIQVEVIHIDPQKDTEKLVFRKTP